MPKIDLSTLYELGGVTNILRTISVAVSFLSNLSHGPNALFRECYL